jgi:hypothetical protein
MPLPGQSVSPGSGVIGEHFTGYRGALSLVLLLSFYAFPYSGKTPAFPGSSPPSDTLEPHTWPFPGMLNCHPGLAFGRTGWFCLLAGLLSGLLVLSGVS